MVGGFSALYKFKSYDLQRKSSVGKWLALAEGLQYAKCYIVKLWNGINFIVLVYKQILYGNLLQSKSFQQILIDC